MREQTLHQCKSCGQSIPAYTEIEGKRQRLKDRAYCLDCVPFKSKKPSDFFYKHKKEKLMDELRCCKKCQEHKPHSQFYFTNKKHSWFSAYCQSCSVLIVEEKRKNVKQMAVDYKGRKCAHCLNSFPNVSYDFHHLDPTKKDFGIGERTTMSWNSRLKEELDKCIMLCSNCHRIEHQRLCGKEIIVHLPHIET